MDRGKAQEIQDLQGNGYCTQDPVSPFAPKYSGLDLAGKFSRVTTVFPDKRFEFVH